MGLQSPKISVIVPVYNAGQYLEQCIQSILDQTFTDFELILVDDGSTDGSGEICDIYKNKNPKVKVIHKDNEGVSIARNIGIDNADGTYIVFVDSDDYVDKAYLSDLMISEDSDFVVSGVYLLNEKNVIVPGSVSKKIKSSPAFIDTELIKLYMRVPWAKRFKKEIIIRDKIFFNSMMKIGEDTDFNIRYLQVADDIVTVSSPSYFYRDNFSLQINRCRLDALQYDFYINRLSDSINGLKNVCKYSFPQIDSDLKIFFRRLFFTHLISINNYSSFKKESINFKIKKLKYYSKNKIKESIVSIILRHFPLIAYIGLSVYRRY